MKSSSLSNDQTKRLSKQFWSYFDIMRKEIKYSNFSYSADELSNKISIINNNEPEVKRVIHEVIIIHNF